MSGVPMSSRARQRIPVAPGVIAIWVIVTWITTITGPLAWAQSPTPAPGPAPGTPGATAPAVEAPRSEDPAQGKWSRLLERLLFNPRERTVRGFDAVARAQSAAPVDTELPATSPDTVEPDAAPSGIVSPGTVSPGTVSPGIVTDADRAAEAIGPFDSAARLLGSDDRGAYNAGTARLLAERADAAQLFESILDTEDDKLASNAAFNLGNSHLDTGQLEGAVDAFKKSLRRDPSRGDAKHNLEIALRRLREQQQEQKQQQDQNQQDGDQEEQDQQQQKDGEQGDQEEQQKDGEQGEQEQQDEQQKGDEQEQEQDGEPQEQEQEQPQDGEQGEQEESPLPQFEDQPDMTAEEAAAILEAVENLEREARRQAALEAARKQAKGKKDW